MHDRREGMPGRLGRRRSIRRMQHKPPYIQRVIAVAYTASSGCYYDVVVPGHVLPAVVHARLRYGRHPGGCHLSFKKSVAEFLVEFGTQFVAVAQGLECRGCVGCRAQGGGVVKRVIRIECASQCDGACH